MTKQPKYDVWVLGGALTEAEKELAWQVAGGAEAALGSRRPELVSELVAHLLAGILFEHCEHQNAEDVSIRVLKHVFARIEALTRETTEAFERAAVARAGKAGKAPQ